MTRKTTSIIYWITTALVVFAMATGGVAQLIRVPANVEGMAHLGYPIYVTTILGVWKLLGSIALVAPRLPRLKEWAYAGIVFDLTGAVVSHLASGDGIGHWISPAILAALAMVSWALRPASRVLGSLRSS